MNVDFASLTLLVDIIDAGNLSKAASKLKMTRANVSYHLRQLERRLHRVSVVKQDEGRGGEVLVDAGAMQLHGAAGLEGDGFLAHAYAGARALRIADGPDEVHLASLAKGMLR